MRLSVLLPSKAQESPLHQQSLVSAWYDQICLLTCGSGTAGGVMRGLNPSSLCKRGCSLSLPSLTHPNEGKAGVTWGRWRPQMISSIAEMDGGIILSLKMILLAVRVMRYVCCRWEMLHFGHASIWSASCVARTQMTMFFRWEQQLCYVTSNALWK